MKHLTPPKKITVGELRARLLDQLNALDDDDEVMFAGGLLTVNRSKQRGPKTGRKLIDIEFNELFKVTYDPDSEN